MEPMTQQLSVGNHLPWDDAISPWREMAAYEALWLREGQTFKRVADLFRKDPTARPSDLLPPEEIDAASKRLHDLVERDSLGDLGIRVMGTGEYPGSLQDAQNPLQVFYYQGIWDLVRTPSVAVVGSRKVSDAGLRRTRKLVHHLVKDGFTIVSGLASGVDSAAHRAALEFGGLTYGVIGTPLNHIYPKENSDLQRLFKERYLLISQVPFLKYEQQDFRKNRSFFPERNITMSALTKATIIVEASDTSGTLYQARAALAQGRKLFILESCFQNSSISWPERFEKKGAVRVKDYRDIREHIVDESQTDTY